MRRLKMATCTSGEPVSDLWTRNCEITFILASLANAIRKSILLVFFLTVLYQLQDNTTKPGTPQAPIFAAKSFISFDTTSKSPGTALSAVRAGPYSLGR